MDVFPRFLYHPDPIGSGVIIPSTSVCACCQQARGFVYEGPVYADVELFGRLCPWCIHKGLAYTTFNASFTDEAAIGGYSQWAPVAQEVIETIAYRTPCFIGWQQERWWTHCRDGAVFIEAVGISELQRYGAQALNAISEETGLFGDELRIYLSALNKKGSPTAYLFQCRRCGMYGGYSDYD